MSTKPYGSLDGEMHDPGGVFGASHLHGSPAVVQSIEINSFQCTRRHTTLGDVLCIACVLSAGASVRQVPDVCHGAFGSVCRALVVAHTANVETRSSPFAKHARRSVCTLRIVIFRLDLFVSH